MPLIQYYLVTTGLLQRFLDSLCPFCRVFLPLRNDQKRTTIKRERRGEREYDSDSEWIERKRKLRNQKYENDNKPAIYQHTISLYSTISILIIKSYPSTISVPMHDYRTPVLFQYQLCNTTVLYWYLSTVLSPTPCTSIYPLSV